MLPIDSTVYYNAADDPYTGDAGFHSAQLRLVDQARTPGKVVQTHETLGYRVEFGMVLGLPLIAWLPTVAVGDTP